MKIFGGLKRKELFLQDSELNLCTMKIKIKESSFYSIRRDQVLRLLILGHLMIHYFYSVLKHRK